MNTNYKELYERCLEEKQSLISKGENFELTDLPWAGNLGQWTWSYLDNVVTFNPKKVSAIGFDVNEFDEAIGFQFFTNRIHPDDYEMVMENMRQHLTGKTDAYEIAYRIQHKDGYYIWFYDRGIVVSRDDVGKPIKLVGIVFDITEQKRVEQQLKDLSERDPLTELYNRRIFNERLNNEINRYMRYSTPVSLLIFDIDNFKKINDEFGHIVGDEVLVTLSDVCHKAIRTNDIFARFGGEEFAVILPQTSLDQAIQVANKIQLVISEIKLSIPKIITVSIGVVEYQGEDNITFIKRADDKMYSAKQNGRNRIES